MGFGYFPAYHIATENPPAHDATEGPPAYKRSGGIQDILLRLSAAEKPPASFQIGEIAEEALLRNQRNRGILLTCLFASCEISAAEALLRMGAAEESSCGISAAED